MWAAILCSAPLCTCQHPCLAPAPGSIRARLLASCTAAISTRGSHPLSCFLAPPDPSASTLQSPRTAPLRHTSGNTRPLLGSPTASTSPRVRARLLRRAFQAPVDDSGGLAFPCPPPAPPGSHSVPSQWCTSSGTRPGPRALCTEVHWASLHSNVMSGLRWL